MALKDELEKSVADVFVKRWTIRNGINVPESENLQLGNDAVELDGTILYADLDESTALVDNFKPEFSAEIYKAFLYCAARIIRYEGGVITSYDGDRIMAVFIGESKNTSAARTALKINSARIHIINPAIKKHYQGTDYELHHTVGIDASKLFIARTGIRGSNDLVWVGRAANHAAKLTTLSADFPSRITKEVYDMLHDEVKYSSDNRLLWEPVTWNTTGRKIYRSTWYWKI